jgi:hypothetical protein
MPERTIHPGKYGARGVSGFEAVARTLERHVEYIATPVTERRGLMARLRYLTTSDRTRAAARDAGLTVTPRTISAWLRGKQNPSPANLARIDQAYRKVRRDNTVRQLRRRLEAGGGTRIEIHPLDQTQTSLPHRRDIPLRRINVRHWGPLVDAWAYDDHTAGDDAWIDLISADLGSEWGEYEYVTTVGFGA